MVGHTLLAADSAPLQAKLYRGGNRAHPISIVFEDLLLLRQTEGLHGNTFQVTGCFEMSFYMWAMMLDKILQVRTKSFFCLT